MDEPGQAGSSGRLELLLRAVLADVDAVLDALDAEHRQELRALVDDDADRSPRQLLLALEDLLLWAELPEDHPVSRALITTKYAATPVAPMVAPTVLMLSLRQRLGSAAEQLPHAPPGQEQVDQAHPPSDPSPPQEPAPPGSVPAVDFGTYASSATVVAPPEFGSEQAVLEQLAGLPSLDPGQVGQAGIDPELPDLIRLPYQGTVRLPRFQFDLPVGRPGTARAIVLEVNELLGAEHDPWGAAGWWTGLHAWLERVPVELLDEQGGPDELRLLARAEVSD